MNQSDAEATAAPVSPGAVLRAAREQAGLSLLAVGDRLHLLPRQITALEVDDYSQFNGDIFCRGYIKNYAKLLDMDVEPLLLAYLQLSPKRVEKLPQSARTARQIQHAHRGSTIHYWFAAATVLVVVILWAYGTGEENKVNKQATPTSQLLTVDKNTLINPAAMVEKPAAIESVIKAAPMTVAANRMAERALMQDSQSMLIAAVEQSEPGSAGPREFAVTVAEEKNLLSFNFAEDCWVEVRDRDNRVIFADMKRASDTLVLNGKAPFKVLLGYAHGVSVNYNGEPVAFDVNQQNNAARLIIGQL